MDSSETEELQDTGDEYRRNENMWDEQWPTSGPTAVHPDEETDNIDEEAPFPDASGTTDSLVAVRDAEPYTPPIDPPVLPGGREGIHVATGFGLSTDETTADEPASRGDEDIHDDAVLALRQDSLTSTLPLTVQVRQGVVRLVGDVASIDEAEHAASILGYVPGVVDVIDETTINPDASVKPPQV